MQNEALRQAQIDLEASRDRYVDLYEFSPVGYITLSPAGLIEQINLTGSTLLGEDRNQLTQKRFALFVAPEERDLWQLVFMRLLGRNGNESCELMMQRKDGTLFHAHLDNLHIDGEQPQVRIALSDISDRYHAEEELRIAAIAFESQEGMMVSDSHGVIVRVNQAFTRLTGYSAAEAVGQTASLLRSGRHDKLFYDHMWQALRDRGFWQGEIWNKRKSGKVYAEWLTISAVKDPKGVITHYVGTFSDITQNKEAEAEIHRLAYYDSLTFLPNRRLLLDRLSQALAISARNGHHGALLFLDLDNFKVLNDTRGHAVGDLLLKEVAQRLRVEVREGDTVSRLGGDEFVVLLEELSVNATESAFAAQMVSEKLVSALAVPYKLDGCEFHYTTSIGVTLFHGHADSVDTLLRQADMAVYRAKRDGRNRQCFFDPTMQSKLDEHSAMVVDLRQAMQRGELALYFQPQMDNKQRIIGAEALLRWQHPQRGLVMPDVFIPVAEETGLIIPIGQWVLECACSQIKVWSEHSATRELCLAINVSPLQFRQSGFVEDVERILVATGADPHRLRIELTEGLVIENVADTINRMQVLKALGIGFSMDDFGTGFSSLSYLKRLPLDELKIDRSFVNDLVTDPNDAAIAKTIIIMGQTLGLNVIAEGVETEEQLALLKQYGCNAFQGYLFSRPIPLSAFEEFIDSVEIKELPWLRKDL
ncbi:MAG: EAL domain-containing protein [Sedimenticola thiotaurini]|uniref:cyclic-guanylate-specific phosphodiesterase n=1 Tax=Sedimenticola thiotaurini TaxID=1543721 RepID=A0A558D5P3_9GAMM|nr:MAG: EAL domain-containing protein [Sedimenticola thiotaurini]